MRRNYANPASKHVLGNKSAALLANATSTIAAILNVAPHTIIYTSGATEGANLLVRSISNAPPERRLIVATPLEHPSLYRPLESLPRRLRIVVPKYNSNDPTQPLIAEIERQPHLLAAVVAQAANNETGTTYDLHRLAQAMPADVPLISDVSQSFLYTKPASSRTCLIISGHKIMGPQGIGLVTVAPSLIASPIFLGGGQQNNLRSGTIPLPLVLGLATAIEIAAENRDANIARAAELAGAFIDELDRNSISYLVNGGPCRLSSTLSLTFNIAAERLIAAVPSLCISQASACTGSEHSHVLTAMGLNDNQINRTIRISFGLHLNISDVVIAANRLATALISKRGVQHL
jgi:cysteine desulfurase